MNKKFILPIAALGLLFSAALRAQEPLAASPPASPAGSPVSLSLIVTDNENKGVSSIRKDQIRIFEGKVEQTIISIEADERPADYCIAIDGSGSFRRWINPALDVIALIVKNRRPTDEISIEKFVSSDRIEKYQDFTSDGDALINSLKNFFVEGGQSAVVDALYVAADYVAEHNKANRDRRKAVIIITDGEDRKSFYKQEALVKLLRETGVQVFVLGLVSDLDNQARFNGPGSRAKAEKLLKMLAGESGGRVFFARDREELINAATEVILDLRGQFRINYQSTKEVTKNGFHEVEVKFVSTDGEKRELVVPRGYFVGPRTAPSTKTEKKP